MCRFGAVADIRKAFLQMEVAPVDRNSLRFVWWDYPEDDSGAGPSTDEGCRLESVGKRKEVGEFRHCRVVFGVSSSPFLLGATLKYLLEGSEEFQETAARLLRAFYVDNCVISLDSMEELEKFKVEAQALLSPAQFDLRGWEFGPSEDGKVIPVLGISWDSGSDTLQVVSDKLINRDQVLTKRGILSIANSVYDPLGFLAPFTLNIKLLLKKVWMDEAKYSWDKELPETYREEMDKWQQQLKFMDQMSLPRYFGGEDDNQEKWSLHVFSDASKDAYATCVFLRIEGNPVRVQLVQSRTRVSPSKNVTIPRLELLSCLIGSRLARSVKESMDLEDIPTVYWTDSTTALTWIRRDSTWATFVMNRVKEIREITSAQDWRHIPGEHNPADVCSRSCSLERLIGSRWWEGPSWLKSPEEKWPSSQPEPDEDEIIREMRKTVVSALNVVEEEKFFQNLTRYGDFSKITRILAYVRRFCYNVQTRARENGLVTPGGSVPDLETTELEKAERSIVKHIQQQSFDGPSSIKGLLCRADEDGIIRVETKLTEQDSSSFHSPAVLPGKNPLVKLLIRKEHENALHAGVQYLQSLLREQYWITNSRRSIRNVVHDCAVCRRFLAKRCEQDEAPLPRTRTSLVKAFQVTGVDMAGPMFVEKGKKVWVCLFTCAVYRAVHLELVSSLSTQAFLEVLDKFVSRRGRPNVIYSDNGRNFAGAANMFRRMDMDRVGRHAALKKIRWIFIAPTGSWWGGWWERLIGMMKALLRRVIGNRRLQQSQLEVLLCEAEAVMNERALTYISDDPMDLKPLTPAMFIRDVPTSELPETGLLTRLRKLTKLKEELRMRFRREYLGKLIHNANLRRNRDVLKPGDVVLVGMDHLKRKDWPVGLIIEIYPGIDDKVRTVKLRTRMGEIVRPVQRLYPLEVMDDEMKPSTQELEG